MPEQSSARLAQNQAQLHRLGAKLKRLRREANLSVTELAKASGLSRRHVTEAEAGRANLTVASLLQLALALGRAPSELLELAPSSARVALVGLRGAGKSSVGRALALALEVPFVELDRRVEELAGMPLASVFDLYGVSGFRRLEAEALERVLAQGDELVLAASGSVVDSPATFARLRATCRTVWLQAKPEEHFQRVEAQGDRRPMLGRPRALEELRALLAKRRTGYARCELAVNTSGQSVEQVVGSLLAALRPG
jgi:XRE family aerobic/anaerobic benzoate catabolism transcriptional regulator